MLGRTMPNLAVSVGRNALINCGPLLSLSAEVRDGADAVIRQGDGFRKGSLDMFHPRPDRRLHICLTGGDMQLGHATIAEGTCLGPHDIPACACAGVDQVHVEQAFGSRDGLVQQLERLHKELDLIVTTGFDDHGRELAEIDSATHSARVGQLPATDGLIVLPAQCDNLPAGELVEYLPFHAT